jgi:hypothetical protein
MVRKIRHNKTIPEGKEQKRSFTGLLQYNAGETQTRSIRI